jgi:anti-sigma regulatory factor (Ser/Thr protein kinase)
MTDDALPPVSMRLPRGPEAPRQARHAVIDQLGDRLGAAAANDVALVVSELVTNSVREPARGAEHELGLDVGVVADHVLIAVSDRGAQIVPRAMRRGTGDALGLGLQLVDRLAQAWGVARDGAGHTKVWCELPLDPSGPSGELHVRG